MRLEGWSITRWASLALFGMVGAILLDQGWSDTGLHAVVRWTARTSVVLFLLAFTASSLVRLRPAPPTRWLLRNRRYVGVGFAVSHFLHLAALAGLAVWFPEPFVRETSLLTLVGGGLAYVFIFAMALTSSDRAQAWLGMARWRRLHLVGGYVIWLIFAQSYVPVALVEPAYVPIALVVLAAPVVRVAPRLLAARRKQETAAAADASTR